MILVKRNLKHYSFKAFRLGLLFTEKVILHQGEALIFFSQSGCHFLSATKTVYFCNFLSHDFPGMQSQTRNFGKMPLQEIFRFFITKNVFKN